MAGKTTDSESAGLSKATFAAGCFWCVEAVFQRVAGVAVVRSGYTGGRTDNPTYEDIGSGKTGHAEALEIDFDAQQVSFEDLLAIFWQIHDPTQLNRQGADVGTQYRSAIFYHDEAQRIAAENSKRQLVESGVPVVTQIEPAGKFYKAEAYHQDYYNRNAGSAYCTIVIEPKLRKLGLERALEKEIE